MKKVLFVVLTGLFFLGSCKKEDISPINESKVSFEDIDKAEKAAPYIQATGGDDPAPMP